jgi:hypothetical protein
VDDDPGGLVDDEEVRVLVDDGERNVLRGQLLRRELRRVGLNRLPACELVALRSRLAVDEDGACGEQLLRRRARADRGLDRQEAVEPRPRRVLRNQ